MISLTHALFSDKYSLLTWTLVRKPRSLRLLVNITKDLPVPQLESCSTLSWSYGIARSPDVIHNGNISISIQGILLAIHLFDSEANRITRKHYGRPNFDPALGGILGRRVAGRCESRMPTFGTLLRHCGMVHNGWMVAEHRCEQGNLEPKVCRWRHDDSMLP